MPDETVLTLRLSLMGRLLNSYRFGKPVISVGRDPQADVVIDNPGVSREHLRLERLPDGEYEVVDMGSANGTFLNDLPVRCKIPLRQGDSVRFGKYTLTVGYEHDRRATDRSAPAPPPMVSEHQTVVLTRSELNHLLELQTKAEANRPLPPQVVRDPEPVAVAVVESKPMVAEPPKRSGGHGAVTLLAGFAIGAAAAAGAMWAVFRH